MQLLNVQSVKKLSVPATIPDIDKKGQEKCDKNAPKEESKTVSFDKKDGKKITKFKVSEIVFFEKFWASQI